MAFSARAEDFSLELTEEHGCPSALTFQQLIQCDDPDLKGPAMAVAALLDPDLRQANSAVFERNGLVVARRRVRMIPNKTRAFYLVYECVPYGQDDLNGVYTVGSSMSQETTGKDIHGNELFVMATDPVSGEQTKQTAEVPVFVPQTTLNCSLKYAINNPTRLVRLWNCSVNAYPWCDANAGQWLCSCTARPLYLGSSPRTWVFDFTFQLNIAPGGWEAFYWAKNSDGTPQADLVPGVSVKQIDWYTKLDFRHTAPFFLDW